MNRWQRYRFRKTVSNLLDYPHTDYQALLIMFREIVCEVKRRNPNITYQTTEEFLRVTLEEVLNKTPEEVVNDIT